MIERREHTLGQDLVQCCGGEVELLYECYPPCDFDIALFGAGHVGSALITVLGELPCRVRWHDSRNAVFDQVAGTLSARSHIAVIRSDNPFLAVEQCVAHSFYLVMTHSHEIDFELCEAILGRSDIRFCGLIGSRSKAASFRSRLLRKGFSQQEVDRLVSPVGLALGAGKQPMEVAVAVAAQLLQIYYGDERPGRIE